MDAGRSNTEYLTQLFNELFLSIDDTLISKESQEYIQTAMTYLDEAGLLSYYREAIDFMAPGSNNYDNAYGNASITNGK